MDAPLKNRVALVTGSAKRLGRAVALRLAREGADVAIHYHASEAAARETVSDVEKLGHHGIALAADLGSVSEIQRLFQQTFDHFGRLDILVNNAGTFFPVEFAELTEEQWDRIMDTNLKSQFLCAQAAAPIMKRQGRGRIINLSSLGGILAWPKFTHYCVSKAGVIMLTRCLARALAPEILVNSVAPGTIQFPGELPDEDYIWRVPLHRVGDGDDVANAVAYLTTADFVTGQVLVVDGGRALV